ncbi:MAG: tetratricopeptide repeat protein [Acidobacteria bacterium]|nr:tetratricopeptide repeat protein [Acidobacteriota bacterium]
MDIWAWVYDEMERLQASGQGRLAQIMENISSYTCDDQHHKVDAIYPEGLALARKQPNKWIEIYLRHWYLQSQVLSRKNVRGMLSESVDLLDFAHQPGNSSCPQSVCTVQDLCCTYSLRDGKGFVQERIAVCQETLARIDASWPCFFCIGSEYVSALSDAGRHEETLLECDRLRTIYFQQNLKEAGSDLVFNQVRALIDLGRYEEAESIARAAENPGLGSGFQRKRQSYIALSLAFQGKYELAIQEMLPLSEVLKAQGHFFNWCELNYLLASHLPERNHPELNQQLNQLCSGLIQNGAIRHSIQIRHWQAELALQRSDLFTVKRCINSIQALIPELYKDLGASEDLADLNARFDQAVAARPVVPIGLDANTSDLELNLFDLEIAFEAQPDQPELGILYGQALEENGFLDEAQAVYQRLLKQNPEHTEVLHELCALLLQDQRFQELDRLLLPMLENDLDRDTRLACFWYLALRQLEVSPQDALAWLEKLLALSPQAKRSLHIAANIEVELGRYESALSRYNQLLELTEEPQEIHWRRMLPATLLGHWDLVRESCAAVGINLDTDSGPIEENWGVIRIQIQEQEETSIIYAAQTGPVTAELISIRPVERKQVYGWQVVFDPQPLNQLDQKDEDGDPCDAEGSPYYLFKSVAIPHQVDYFAFAIDGVFPGDEIWDELVTVLESLGVVVSRRSGDQYVLPHPEDEDVDLPAIYAIVLVPPTVDLMLVHHALKAQLEQVEHPLIWPLLVAELGDAETLALHADIEARYQIE